MNNSDLPCIYSEKQAVEKNICSEILNLYKNSEESIYNGITKGGLMKTVKNTRDMNFPLGNAKWIKYEHIIYNAIQRALKNYTNWLDKERNINIRNSMLVADNFLIQSYKQNEGMYKEHHDASVYYNRKMNRMITFIIYLNDVEEGGETDFFRGNIKIKPEVGKIVLFPATWCYPHKAVTPISSDKTIITGWLCEKCEDGLSDKKNKINELYYKGERINNIIFDNSIEKVKIDYENKKINATNNEDLFKFILNNNINLDKNTILNEYDIVFDINKYYVDTSNNLYLESIYDIPQSFYKEQEINKEKI